MKKGMIAMKRTIPLLLVLALLVNTLLGTMVMSSAEENGDGASQTKETAETVVNDYTSLFVQDGLFRMIAPMTQNTDDLVGTPVTAVTDLAGNTYTVPAGAKWVESGINLGYGNKINFGAGAVPLEGDYTVQTIFAFNDEQVPTEAITDPLPFFVAGPVHYYLCYIPRTTDDSNRNGISKTVLWLHNGEKRVPVYDFDVSWGSPLLEEEYDHIFEISSNISVTDAMAQITVLKDRTTVITKNTPKVAATTDTMSFGPSFNLNMYAILVYDHTLSEEELLQNHFASLMAYYKVDMTKFLQIEDPVIIEELYALLNTVRLGESSKEDLQAIVDNYAITGGLLGNVNVNDYVSYKGVQTRIKGKTSARALFAFDPETLATLEQQGCTLQYGILLSEYTEGMTVADLKMTYNNSIGEYTAPDGAEAFVIYNKGEFCTDSLYDKGDGLFYAAATLPSYDAEDANNSLLKKEYIYRAYVCVDMGGKTFTLYLDPNEYFGSTLSVYEAAEYFLYAGYASSPVLSAVCGDTATAGALAAQDARLTAENAYNTAADAILLVPGAHTGAVAAKKQNDVDVSSININMDLITALSKGTQAAASKYQAELYANIGLQNYTLASEQIVAAREAANPIYQLAYDGAITAGADQETAEKIGAVASEKLLSRIADVETQVTKLADAEKEMSSVLNAFLTSYYAENILGQIFNAGRRVNINKTALNRYAIVTDSEHLDAASALQRLALQQLGVSLGVYCVDNEYIGTLYDYTDIKNAIFMGLTQDTLSDQDFAYSFYADDTHIFMEGTDSDALATAATVLIRDLCDSELPRLNLTVSRGENALLDVTYKPLVWFKDAYDYGTLTFSDYDAEGIFEIFLQKKEAMPTEMTVQTEKTPDDYPISQKKQFFVSTDGNDNNAGTIDAPFATIARGLEAVKGLGGAVLWIRGGIYTITETLVLDALHSGSVSAPTFISAYNGEKVSITSSKVVPGDSFKSIDAAIADGMIDASIRDRLNTFGANNSNNVYVAPIDVEAYGYQELTTKYHPNAYVNGTEAVIARWPNLGEEDSTYHIENGLVPFSDITLPNDNGKSDIVSVGRVTVAASSLYEIGKDLTGGWIVCFDNYPYKDRVLQYDQTDLDMWTHAAAYEEWERSYYNVSMSVDDQGRNLLTSEQYCTWGAKEYQWTRNDMYFFNILEELNSPDEYLVDREKGLMYIYCEEAPTAETEVLLSSDTFKLMSLTGAENVIIDGIDFTMANDVSVYMTSCQNVVMQNCTVHDTTATAVSINKSVHCGLLDCLVYNIHATSVTIAADVKNVENFVQNSHIIGSEYRWMLSYAGIRTVISHNTLENGCSILSETCAYETVLEYNDILRGPQTSNDVGPFYTCAGYGKRDNHIRYNLFHDINVAYGGIYCDEQASGMYIYYNVIESTHQLASSANAISIPGGNMNVVYNNICINAGNAGVGSSETYYPMTIDGVKTGGWDRGLTWKNNSKSWLSHHTTLETEYTAEEIARRFPLYAWYIDLLRTHVAERDANPNWIPNDKYTDNPADVLEIFLRSPSNNVVIQNIAINCTNTVVQTDPLGKNLYDKNLTCGPYAASQILQGDLGFIDEENDDYRLKEDSPIYSFIPTFENLPLDRVGILNEDGSVKN